MTLSRLIGVAVLAVIEGALVALPRSDALDRLGRLSSPAWAALLPGLIVFGTFGVRALPPMATGIVVLASVGTPLLAGVAVLAVVRGPRVALLPIALALPIIAELLHGWTRELSASMLTGLGCLTLGVGMVRLIPRRYMLPSILCMCAVDVLLLAIGAGEPAAAELTHAAATLHKPAFDAATIGPISTDYPDLMLVGVLAGLITSRTVRWRAAALLTILTAGYGVLLELMSTVPATVPIAVTFIAIRSRRVRASAPTPLPSTSNLYRRRASHEGRSSTS